MLNPFSWRNIPTARTLFIMIFLAGSGLIISIIALIYLSLHLISTRANEIDAQRTALSVQGAIQTSVNRIWSLVIDNSVWDDAVEELYRPQLDREWLYTTWGADYKVNNLYDGTFVLDEHFNVLWGSFRSQDFTERNLDFFGDGLAALIRKNAQTLPAGKQIFAGLTRTREGVAFVGIGLIRPMLGRLPVSDGMRRYLVITRHLNPQLLRELGNTFQIKDLHFSPEKISQSSVPLRGSAGELLGYLSWTPRLPGAEAAHAASGNIRQIALLAAGLILLFITLSSAGLYKLAKGEKSARRIAFTDWLSRLPNRRALIEHLEKMSASGPKEMISVVFIDLDGFKDVNDIYGHDVGDRLIATIAHALREKVPRDGMLARMGGDEFALTLGGPWSQEQASEFASHVLQYLSAPVRIGKRTIHIGASIGIASGTLQECSSSELFRRADIAMYHSKTNGKSRITHYDAELNLVRERELRIESDIRDGLDRDEFDVWYQPIVDARTQTMIAVEALVRWCAGRGVRRGS